MQMHFHVNVQSLFNIAPTHGAAPLLLRQSPERVANTPFPSSMSAHSKLMEIAEAERPQERLERLGSSALSDVELIAMILRSGSKRHNVAGSLLNDAGSLSQLI